MEASKMINIISLKSLKINTDTNKKGYKSKSRSKIKKITKIKIIYKSGDD